MSSDKEHDIPQEIKDMDIEVLALEGLRDVYAKRPFGYKKALKASRAAIKSNLLFWRKVRKLYPQFSNNEISYSRDKGTLIIKD